MESFDQSLKYLLQHEPEDFVRFGLGEKDVDLEAPIPSGLPSRGRDVDGGYIVVRGNGERIVAHVELHRRHQALEELAVDVAEAQIRLHRREGLPILSLVWDLYGNETEPLFRERTWTFGVALHADSQPSRCSYRRVNLRALTADALLATAPPVLWPLVALTRDGATSEAVRRARDAIESRADLTEEQQTDHLAVLWYVSEAEDVPIQLIRMYLAEEKLMESSLYRNAFDKGVAQGEARGTAAAYAKMLIYRLRCLGTLDVATRDHIRAVTDIATLEKWCEEAMDLRDADAARAFAQTILSAKAE